MHQATILFVGLGLSLASAAVPNTFLWSPEALQDSLKRVKAGDPSIIPARDALLDSASKWKSVTPPSVMDKSKPGPSGDSHDYVSLDKYYWPCNAPPPAEAGGDPTCKKGILHHSSAGRSVCCLLSCGQCTGTGCADFPGGEDGCCQSPILAANHSCDTNEAPCVLDDNYCDPTTGLPWVQHDGQVNPAMKNYDHDNLLLVADAVMTLSLSHYFTSGTEWYGAKAAEMLKTWFLDSKTAMNPNMNYGHFIPGVSDGSHGALIDSHWMSEFLDAVEILALFPDVWSATDHAALKTWNGQFLDWMVTSKLGQQEQAATNNHGVWYDVQALALALHVGASNVTKNITGAAHARVDVQILGDGQLPAEEARTKAFSYSEFCLDAFFHLATLAASAPAPNAVDLFAYKNSAGASIRSSIIYQLPYIQQDKPWPYSQIVPFFPPDCKETMVDQCVSTYIGLLRMGANHYKSQEYETAAKNLPGVQYDDNRLNLVIPSAL